MAIGDLHLVIFVLLSRLLFKNFAPIFPFYIDLYLHLNIVTLSCCAKVCNRSDGPVVERLPHNRYVVGSSLGRVIPKTLKMVLTAFSLRSYQWTSPLL